MWRAWTCGASTMSRHAAGVHAWPRSYCALPQHSAWGGANASQACKTTFSAWHETVGAALSTDCAAEDSVQRLRPHIHPDCVFKPPTYFKAWHGRDEALLLLSCVGDVFGTSFRYGRQWLSDDGREWALEFSADVAATGKQIDGIDLVSLSEDGRIREFTVLARPPNAVAALKSEMMMRVPLRLAKLKAKQALGLDPTS